MARPPKKPDAQAVEEALKRVFEQLEARPAPEALVEHAIKLSTRKSDPRN